MQTSIQSGPDLSASLYIGALYPAPVQVTDFLMNGVPAGPPGAIHQVNAELPKMIPVNNVTYIAGKKNGQSIGELGAFRKGSRNQPWTG